MDINIPDHGAITPVIVPSRPIKSIASIVSISTYVLYKLCLIWILIVFVGCVTTTKTSDTELPEGIIKSIKPKPKIIRINPNIRMPIRDQIIWHQRLEGMDANQKLKTFRMLRDGMFKTEEQLEKLNMIFPRPAKHTTI